MNEILFFLPILSLLLTTLSQEVSASSENHEIDSLLLMIEESTLSPDSSKIVLENILAMSHARAYQNGIGKSYYQLGLVWRGLGDFEKSRVFLDSAKNNFSLHGDEYQQMLCLKQIGIVYFYEGELEKSIGFDISQRQNGIGMDSIQDRLNTFKGKINIDSVLGRGTINNIDLPIVKQSEEQKQSSIS